MSEDYFNLQEIEEIVESTEAGRSAWMDCPYPVDDVRVFRKVEDNILLYIFSPAHPIGLTFKLEKRIGDQLYARQIKIPSEIPNSHLFNRLILGVEKSAIGHTVQNE